ncbi:hypothetical protein A3G63_02195 [Candidatus Kaiserbacteria bacterium RIFCSPLOWO2_12_FULL_52_8]|uniref:Transposase IS200-like domain-containing protein n=1 Tax=Candidatus Kaiserbacteria bacterium RIFCSPHIGHO2_01_FULL_53_31 TaxID=1798481 RepID=A0A1F6CJ85_9BACT|nr:MAG: hypothetical protein A2678_00095 [Candidatus Kaiserbacteria bacterium RIFCSPHIGHO2_01_FULL_53_31]OGG93009.1 MAG: hypothetical protein A3G63_02195 [Candidatus Kaiserbacteria bacterium RIFCSPLOWO2_12_FULL_52_8]
MATRKSAFAVGEWYHCYSRGVDKRIVYEDEEDYMRFLEQLYLANSNTPLRRDDIIGSRDFEEILTIPRNGTLVAIEAFCLMPNHFHLVIKEIVEGGISAFMQKLGTSYAMYFNWRYERSGNLFVKPFRSRHISDDRYFQHLIKYLHCNPAELFEPKWKTGKVGNLDMLTNKLIEYPYSSFSAYHDKKSPIRAILDHAGFDVVRLVPPKQMLREANEYFRENPELP